MKVDRGSRSLCGGGLATETPQGLALTLGLEGIVCSGTEALCSGLLLSFLLTGLAVCPKVSSRGAEEVGASTENISPILSLELVVTADGENTEVSSCSFSEVVEVGCAEK